MGNKIHGDKPIGRLTKIADDLPSPAQLMSAMRLGRDEIQAAMRSLPGWSYEVRTRSIVTERRLGSFMEAVQLIRRIARLAERADHHPDLHLTRYRHLKIVLTTHSAKGVTRLDLALAAKIESLLKPSMRT